MNIRQNIIGSLVLFIILFSASFALAHDAWIEVRDYTPAPGEELTMVIANDHYFPARSFMSRENIDEFYLLTPDGRRLNTESYSDLEYKAAKSLTQQGAYLAVLNPKANFFTKTTEGYQRGKSKKGLKNVISCKYSAKFSKAVVNVGAGAGTLLFKPLGHDLEIVPLADPATLRGGDMMPIQVFYKGRPLGGTQVLATYIGFSREKNTFAYATKTAADGKANIRIATPGAWLVAVHNGEDYPDPEVCDENSFGASLTFEIQ